MRKLLVIANCPSENATRLWQAAINGAREYAPETLSVIGKQPLDTRPEDVLSAAGIIVGTTENFGYMSGQIKDFFERIYYPCLEHTEALPWALYVKGGLDGQGAKTSVERIVTGLRWKAIQPAVVMRGEFQPAFIEQTKDLGALMAAGLDAGVF